MTIDARSTRQVQGQHLEAHINRAQNAGRKREMPDEVKIGLRLDSEEAQVIWDKYVTIIGYNDWTASMLSQLGKAVRLEMDLLRGHARLAELEAAGSDRFISDTIANDYYKNLAKAERQQLTLLRALGLTTSPSFVGPAATRGKREREADEAINRESAATGLAGGRPSLLAVN